MTDTVTGVKAEADQLFEVLNAYSVPPLQLEAGFKEYSPAGKDEVVTRVSRMLDPLPESRLLARLPYIRTSANEGSMANTFIVNLRSPDPESRAASLHGLEELRHPAVGDFALSALRDDSDKVLVTAVGVLLPLAKQTPSLQDLIRNLYELHRGQPEFHLTTKLLEAHSYGS